MSATPVINISEGPEFYRVKTGRFMRHLRLLRERRIATDLLVTVEGEEFHLHKVVLVAHLSRFYTVNSSRLRIRGISAKMFKEFVDFCYGNTVRIAPGDVMAMLTACYQLGCIALKDVLIRRITTFIERTPGVLLELFHTLTDNELRMKAHRQILARLEMLQPKLNELDCETMKNFIEFDVTPRNKDTLIAATMAWFRFNPHERLQHLMCFMTLFAH